MDSNVELTDKQLYDAAQANLRGWHAEGESPSHFGELTIYKLLKNKYVGTEKKVQNQLILNAMARLKSEHPDDEQLLRLRFIEKELVHKIASEFGWAESSVYRKQKEAIERLVLVIRRQEENVVEDTIRRLRNRLEHPTYSELVGVDEHLNKLIKQLMADGPPWVIALDGYGGIGKTSLADALARKLIAAQAVTEIGWVTARESQLILEGDIHLVEQPLTSVDSLIEALARQLLPNHFHDSDNNTRLPLDALMIELERKLKHSPHVIFIDNLETVNEVQKLLPKLRIMAGPTKFVLTTRSLVYGEPDIFYYTVPELSLTNALALVRQEGKLRNLRHLHKATDAELLPIWETVGGNPLALRLIAGQTRVHPLRRILDDLHKATGDKSEQLFTYIFHRAWENLDEQSRHVLLAMPLMTARGGGIERLTTITELEVSLVAQTLDRLVALNLIDSHGGLNERLYTIHNLTRTFLQNQVAKWC